MDLIVLWCFFAVYWLEDVVGAALRVMPISVCVQ